MDKKRVLVGAMIVAAIGVALVVYIFTQNLRWACGIAGVLLLVDLIFVPMLLPAIFKQKDDKHE